jgi:phosphoglycolate phosphatase-like HAD superfamily hydrolase
MSKSLHFFIPVFFAIFFFSCTEKQNESVDPLPSWNEGASKKSIIDFVSKTTTEGSKDFIPVADRIAVFDNDGTLWSEKPVPFQLYFVIDRIKELAPQHPEWKTIQPYKALLEGDLKTALAGGEHALLELLMATHAGITTDEFEKAVKDWMISATHPVTGKHFNEMIYQPMLELLDYLRANGYKPFIVSGGGIDFMRVWAEEAYGIPPYQIIGSSVKVKYEVSENGKPVLVKLPELNFNDDKEGKPVGIHQYIGKRPVFAGGNSDGDYAMLQYTCTGNGPHFGMFVHHTDAKREFAYDREPGLARLNSGLDDAKKYGWIIVDMKNDWKKIYPDDEKVKSEVIAIDVLLDPDKTMLDSAKVYNQLMRNNYSGPGSFELDAIHTPHITVMQCFIKIDDLENVCKAVDKVVKSENPTNEKLTASGFYYIPLNGLGLAGITADTTSALLRLQSKLIEAVKPYMQVGTNAAFVQNEDGTPITAGTADYVNGFVPDHSGSKYNPHVTIGLAKEIFLKDLLAKPFNHFTFNSASVSIYQLGDFGTAQKKLWTSTK